FFFLFFLFFFFLIISVTCILLGISGVTFCSWHFLSHIFRLIFPSSFYFYFFSFF
ncbi:hypothetical protein HDV62DRAFT_355848, partial [Trichoderma sp. SZMC 28011]